MPRRLRNLALLIATSCGGGASDADGSVTFTDGSLGGRSLLDGEAESALYGDGSVVPENATVGAGDATLLDAGLAAASPGCPAAPNSAPGAGRDDSGAIALAFDLLGPSHLAVDDTSVYWTDSSGDRVMRAPIAGGWPTVVASTGTPSPAGIAVDGTSVYWASTGGQRLLKCPKGACNCVPTVIGAPLDNVTEIALDAQNVYAIAGGRLLACAVSGCRNNPTVLATGLPYYSAITVDKVNVYWVTPSAIMKCAVGGCANAPTVLAAGPPSPAGIAVDGQNVYWTDYRGGAVFKCAIGGCPGGASAFLGDSGAPAGIATDGVRAFFTDIGPASGPSAGRVLACPVAGCTTPTVLLSGLSFPWSLALDATRVYVAASRRIFAIDK